MSEHRRVAGPPARGEVGPGTAQTGQPPADRPAAGAPAELQLAEITKEFRTRRGTTVALRDVSLTVRPEEFISLVGRSGCGKTTLLRILAGLTSPTSGAVSVGGRPLWEGGRQHAEARKDFGLVFQDANLFPWYSVRDNIALPLKLRGAGRRDRHARAHELCELVGLQGFERSYPRELSGGMRQRAAIARALSYNPRILLMDEPFGALDALTRDKMNLELQAISQRSRATVVFVTHSITEAVFLADRVVLLSPRPGRIRSVTDIAFERPRSLDLESEPGFQDIIRTLRHQLDEEP